MKYFYTHVLQLWDRLCEYLVIGKYSPLNQESPEKDYIIFRDPDELRAIIRGEHKVRGC